MDRTHPQAGRVRGSGGGGGKESNPEATVHHIERGCRVGWGRFFIGHGATVPGHYHPNSQ